MLGICSRPFLMLLVLHFVQAFANFLETEFSLENILFVTEVRLLVSDLLSM